MRKFNILLKKVKEVIDKHDPVGLISGGAPRDEYAGEVIKVIKLLPCDKRKLVEEIYKVFVDSFDEQIAGDKSKYELIAGEIFDECCPFFDGILVR